SLCLGCNGSRCCCLDGRPRKAHPCSRRSAGGPTVAPTPPSNAMRDQQTACGTGIGVGSGGDPHLRSRICRCVLAGAAAELQFTLRVALAQGLSVTGWGGQSPPHLEDRGICKRGWSQRWVWDARHARWVVATVL